MTPATRAPRTLTLTTPPLPIAAQTVSHPPLTKTGLAIWTHMCEKNVTSQTRIRE
jgi:hypothetical protein